MRPLGFFDRKIKKKKEKRKREILYSRLKPYVRKIILESSPHAPKKVEKCNSNLLLAQHILSGLQYLPQCTFLLLGRKHWFPCVCTRGFILCPTLASGEFSNDVILAGSFMVLFYKKPNHQNNFPFSCSCIHRSLSHFLALPRSPMSLLQWKQRKIGSY